MLFLQKKIFFGLPEYLLKLILVDTHAFNTHISENITTYHCRTDTFKHSFFPWTIVEWNKLDLKCQNLLIMYLEAIYLRVSNPCQSLFEQFIACDNRRQPFFKIFSNFVHFCSNFQIFSPF